METNWKPIETAPRAGVDVIVGYDCASVWVVRSAWYRSAGVIEDMLLDGESVDDSDIGWWSYRNSISQEKIEPTHWLCEVGRTPNL